MLDAISKVGSNLETFKDMGKICSKVVLFLMIGNSETLLIKEINLNN